MAEMNNSEKWFDFMDLAKALLLKGQPIDSYQPNIQFAIERSFDNNIFLQLEIKDDKVKWYRTTWLRLIDAPKILDPIESLKYIGERIVPTVVYEFGETNKENVGGIISFCRQVSIQPVIDKWGGIVLDGVFYTLMIGVERTQTTYKWHHLPDGWTDLQKLADMLEELNLKL